MDKHREWLTPVQLATIIVSTIIGVSMLAFPRFVAKEVGTGAPVACLIGILIGFVGLVAIVFLGRRFPKHTVIGYNELILGKVLGRAVSVSLIIFFGILMGLESRQFAEIISGALLPTTPIQVPILLLLILCATTGFQNVATFAYIHFFYMPLIIIPLFIVIGPSFKDIEVYHLLPVLGHDVSNTEFLRGGLIVTKGLIGFFIISMIIPFMKQPKRCVKAAIWGFSIGAFFVLALIIMTLAVFGEIELQQMFWPTLILGRMVHVPAEILARIDSVVIISWIYGVFTTQLSYYFVVVRGIGELFQYYNYRVIALAGIPIVFIVSLLSKDIYQMYNAILVITSIGLFLTVIYPVILALAVKIQKKGVESL